MEDEDVAARPGAYPPNPGHTLVVPRRERGSVTFVTTNILTAEIDSPKLLAHTPVEGEGRP